MQTAPAGYWSSVFYQATLLMKTRLGITGEVAFWLAKDIVDQSIEEPELPLEKAS